MVFYNLYFLEFKITFGAGKFQGKLYSQIFWQFSQLCTPHLQFNLFSEYSDNLKNCTFLADLFWGDPNNSAYLPLLSDILSFVQVVQLRFVQYVQEYLKILYNLTLLFYYGCVILLLEIKKRRRTHSGNAGRGRHWNPSIQSFIIP